MLEVRRIHRSCNRHMPRLRISGIHANGNAVFFGKTGGNEKVAEPLAGSEYRPSAAMAEGRFCVGRPFSGKEGLYGNGVDLVAAVMR